MTYKCASCGMENIPEEQVDHMHSVGNGICGPVRPTLSGPVDASGEPDCPECGYFVGHKDFCTVGHQRATATPPSDTLMVRNSAEFAVRAVADTLLTVLLELPNRYGDNHTIDRRIAIAAAQKMKADAIRAVDAAILNAAAAAAVPSSPAQEPK